MELILDRLLGLEPVGVSATDLRAEGKHIAGFLKGFGERDQGFPDIPRMKGQVLAVKHLAERLRGRFEDIVILGIGGSALGISCLRDALKGPYWNARKTADRSAGPRIFVLDNLDLMEEVEQVVDVDKTLFVVISKSGGTAETMAQYFYFRKKVSKENFVFITDPENGELRRIGRTEEIPMLDMPRNIGGRFSVLTPVGLFPAAMLRIDIEEMLEGAEKALASFEQEEFDLNLPFQMAAVQYLLEWKHGVSMNVMMPYSSKLWTFADWYRQLLAESIGKDGKGLTPIRALGVTDQHSQLQLYNEGPNDKLVMFIEVEEDRSPEIPEVKKLGGPDELDYLSGKTFHELMSAEKAATEKALLSYGKPSLTVKIPAVDARGLGELFMFFQCTIAFLGEYYRIDAFNQPGVELGKKLTKEILSQ